MLKKLAKSIKGFTTHTILSPILIMGEVVMEVIIPVLVALLINCIDTAGSDPHPLFALRLFRYRRSI